MAGSFSSLAALIEYVAESLGEPAKPYIRWFCEPTAKALVRKVCTSLVAKGLYVVSVADMEREWYAAGGVKRLQLQHFDVASVSRYGGNIQTRGLHNERVYAPPTTRFPPFILSIDREWLVLNPIVAEALRLRLLFEVDAAKETLHSAQGRLGDLERDLVMNEMI